MECINCWHELVWDNDYNASDLYDSYEGDDVAMLRYYHCPHCGCTYEILDPMKDDRETEYRKYWCDSVL